MLPVGGTPASGRLLVEGDAFGPLCPGSAGLTRGIENTGAQEFRDELHFVGGQALNETARLGFMRTIGTRNESGYQSTSQGRTPVGEKSYSYLPVLCRKPLRFARGDRTMITGVIVTVRCYKAV
jgi:hypothetical protein